MLIYGASGHGKVIFDCLRASGEKIDGFVDDDPEKTEFLGLPVFRIIDLNLKNVEVVIGIGENQLRKTIAESLNVKFRTVIHPSSVVSPNSVIGNGTVVNTLSAVNSGSTTGKHCIINTMASVDHDCKLGDYVHIAPGAILCGTVTIGSLTWIGAGAVIRENITIGNNVLVGAGSVIVKNIPDNALVIGVPGRIISYMNS
jgi:sugar O-acyltransferase (sialic acid O-acetyltransferase NeuD family)